MEIPEILAELRHQDDVPTHRVIEFIKKCAKYDTNDVEEVVLGAQCLNWMIDGLTVSVMIMGPDENFACFLGVSYGDELREGVDVYPDRIDYVFGSAGHFDTPNDEEKAFLVESFFYRYGLDELAELPDKWGPVNELS